jgi:hypothetical protein
LRSMRSMRWGFIFRNRGPLQKVCRDAETHAKPRLPPGAALGCFREGSCHVTKRKVPRPDGGSQSLGWKETTQWQINLPSQSEAAAWNIYGPQSRLIAIQPSAGTCGLCVLCVLCVVVLFPVVEGPCNSSVPTYIYVYIYLVPAGAIIYRCRGWDVSPAGIPKCGVCSVMLGSMRSMRSMRWGVYFP